MKRTNFAKKFISLLLAALVMVQCSPFVLPARAANYTSAEGDGKVALGSTALGYTQVLTDNGDGTFSLALTLEDMSSLKDHNADSNVSQNGYFTAPADGNYLIELWGGNGANGGEGGTASTGGAGGHVYGIVNLKKGETLFYQLGGNGGTTDIPGTGGGVNGDGGNIGSMATYTIGGGGGYSAIYKFAAGEFESTYLDSDGNLPSDMVISETDRTTKHIMIAAGGGGGGAKSNTEGGLFYDGDAGNPANGGAGGSIGSATHVLDDGGTVFDGYDGETSGSSTQNIGEHGSYVPGGVSNTFINRLVGILGLSLDALKSSLANDWYAATNPDAPGGNGGAGNLRGGAGGAGYCGGGGGIQDEFFIATNVGGGGGGSSYLAAEVDYLNVDDSMLHNGAHDSETGGSIHITALTKDDGSTTTLESLSLTLTPTQYFDLEISAAEGISVSSESNVYTVSGIVLSEGAQTVTLKFTPTSGFAGGNNVPLLEGNAITCTGTNQVVDSNDATGTTTDTCTIPLKANCSAVNVALQTFEVNAHSHTTNEKNPTYPVKSLTENKDGLYTDQYIALRAALAAGEAGWQYAFIASVSEYTVTHNDTPLESTGTVSPTQNTYYPVSITVTPKSGVAAAVGTPVSTTIFTKMASIIILADGTGELNGNGFSYHKTLEYVTVEGGEDYYLLSLHTDISSDYSTFVSQPKTYTNTSGSDTYIAPKNGYYYIQVWGADGGKGGGATKTGGVFGIGNGSSTGGQGGQGGYVEGYLYLTKDTALTISIGAVGQSIDDITSSATSITPSAGSAGGNTGVYINSTTPILVAGGGGGGGAAWRRSTTGKAAYAGQTAFNIEKNISDDECTSMDEVLEKYPGAISSTPWYDVAADDTVTAASNGYLYTESADDDDHAHGGVAGSSYISTVINTTDNRLAATFNNTPGWDEGYQSSNYDGSNGAVTITPLQLEPSGSQTEIADYTVSAQLSDYFVLAGTGNDITATGLYETVKDGNGIVTENHEIIIDYTSIDTKGNNLINISNIDPTVTEQKSETTVDGVTTTTTTRTAHFEIQIKLKPRAGFLGGNDVPLFEVYKLVEDGVESEFSMEMSYSQNNNEGTPEYLHIKADPATDYANVEINYTALPSQIVPGVAHAPEAPSTDRSIDQSLGEDSVPVNNLYEWIGKSNLADYDWQGDSVWEDDFVELVETVVRTDNGAAETGDTITPDPMVTTSYTVTVGLAPYVKTPGATVIAPVSPATASRNIEIIVLPQIHYMLTDIKSSDELHLGKDYSDGYTTIEPGKDHSATLSANTGYKLPGSITVTGADGTLDQNSDYTYDASTGKFVLFAAKADGTVTVAAKADPNTYTVTYYYPNGLGGTLLTQSSKPYKVGDTLNETPPVAAGDTSVPGYTFQWDWGNGATTPPATMPERNLIVIGSYVPNQYTLTIRYESGGTPIQASTEVMVPYSSTYTVTAPDISGYAPVLSTVDVKMDTTEGKTITLEYIPTASQLVVKYLHAYTNEELFAQKTLPIATGDTLILPEVPGKTGYTASAHLYSDGTEFVNSGTVSAEQATNGIYLMVYYTPNTYTVTLDLNGGSAAVTERTVEYDNIYNYDPTTQKYPGLPTPGRVGYEFDGWYLGETKVEGTTTVTTAADHTLQARWKAAKGTVTIVFEDENGNSLSFPGKDTNGETYTYSYVTLTGDVGTTFSYGPPDKDKYEFTPPTVTGTFSATPQRITVTYSLIDKTYTLTIEYITVDEAVETVRETVITEAMSVGAQYTITHKTYAGYKTTFNAWTYTMPEGGPSGPVRIYYYPTEQENVIHVTVNWGELNFTYTQTNWDPQTHTYGSEITPITPNTNTVEVISGSETNIILNVALSYEAVNDYNTLSGYFTSSENNYGTKVTNYTLSPNSAQKSYFWLNGTLTPNQVTAIQSGGGTATSGNCIVTITEG